ncbi:MAG TPA: hypothetical protein VNU01_02925, partial [Egibacteraceae bacterium]|nr:hypothetical protein [Egibacteraceae bacterium]
MGRRWSAVLLVGFGLAALPASAVTAPALPAAPPVTVHEGAPHTPAAPVSSAAATDLRGTFRITAGACAGAVTGSRFRMVQPGGTPASGPFVENADSPCADKTYTPLRPGTDGGLVSGSHQPQPSAPFDGTGNGTAARIVRPQRFFGVDFAVATNPTDPQSGTDTPAPVIRRDGSTLSGDLRAYAVAWNRQHFNQGAPKPDGSTPGQTTLPSGTIDASTKAYRLEWASTIVGGPFNNFTGLWHLEGTFDGALGDQAGPVSQPPGSVPAPPAGG